MSPTESNRGALDPDTWRRIGAVLDRMHGPDAERNPGALAAACQAEGVAVADVEPFLRAEESAGTLPDFVDATLVDAALRGMSGTNAARTLEAGDRIGAFEILAPVGAGGMGEVYRARDTRLGRTVALKLLNADLATRPDGRRRFEREARAISTLNHPHICTLHDVGSAPVTDDGPAVEYLVMELIDGETLASRIARGPLAIDESIEYGAQIADALTAAHRHGIVHRDLKPANVMVTRHGVKVLDFGLAALRAQPAAPVPSLDDTVTGQGTLLGTVQYMAPEQLQGKPTDERADIFALGAILHEMLAGRRAFDGDSTASVIAAIVERTSPSLSDLRPDVPAAVQWAVARCLEKDPDIRWQSAADLAAYLRRAGAGGADAGTAVTVARPRRRLMAAATMALLALAAVTAPYLLTRRPSATADAYRYEIPPPERTEYQRMFAFSPDGRQIAFVASEAAGRRFVWLRPLDALVSRRLEGTDDAYYPFWSPDGRFVGFFADSKLKRIELATGLVYTICDTGVGGGAAWNADGTILFSPHSTTGPALLYQVPASGGTAVPITKPAGTYYVHGWPEFLPDGRRYLYRRTEAGTPSGVFLGQLDSEEYRPLITRPIPADPGQAAGGLQTMVSRAVYADGHVFYVRARALYAQPFDLGSGSLSGDPLLIAEDVWQDSPGRSAFDVSSAGDVAYRPVSLPSRSQLTWLDLAGVEIGRLGDPGTWLGPALAPDGRSVAVAHGGRIVRVDVDRGTDSPVTSRGNVPVWSPDGSQIVFRGASGGPITSIAPADGSQPAGKVLEGRVNAWPGDWSRTGNVVVGTAVRAETGSYDLFMKVVGSAEPASYPVASRADETDPRLSPDDRWLAYAERDGSGTWQLHVRAFNRAGGATRVSPRSGRYPRWSRDGRNLYFVDTQGTLMRATVRAGDTFEVVNVQPLFTNAALSAPNDVAFHPPYDLAPDGRRFLVNVPLEAAKPTPIVVLLNWRRALQR
jgi:Tol biopolymer transport system component